jgi:hypothetical protein
MNKFLINFYFIFFLFYSVDLNSSVQEKILVKVDNEIISLYELNNQIKTILLLSNTELNQTNINNTKKIALSNLINLRIKKKEVLKFNIIIDEQKINAYLKQISKNDLNNLKNKFKLNKINYEVYVENIKTELSWQRLIYNKYNKKVAVNNKQIENKVQLIMKNNKKINEYNFSKIELTFDTQNQIEKKIENINNLINEFGFDEAALKSRILEGQISKSDIGWVNESVLSKNIFVKIKNLKRNEVSLPIIVANNIILLKLNDKRIANTNNLNIEKVKNDLINQKQNEMFDLYSKNDLSKLKNNALIEFNE